MTAVIVRADARSLPLADESVDLIVTSPPYWNQRSYRDGGEHYDGQIGSEPSAREFLEALWEVTAECWRVLKPSGSMWVNLGDKRAGSGAPGTTSGLSGRRPTGTPIPGQARTQGDRSGMVTARDQPDGDRSRSRNIRATRAYGGEGFGREKSKMLLPHRYAIGCEDGAADPDGVGWIVRQDQVWSKLNGLPEPVRDRTADRHEYWFHLARQGDYFAALDELREPHSGNTHPRRKNGQLAPKDQTGIESGVRNAGGYFGATTFNPLGRAPGSVWAMATEPLVVPEHISVDHFAAFPSEWPRRLILGWSPSGVCLECGEGRRPVVETSHELYREARSTGRAKRQDVHGDRAGNGWNGEGYPQTVSSTLITGERCACAPCETPPPCRPAVVLDPFGGTGTTAMVARALGRIGVTVDLSADYGRLARWRIFESGGAAKARERTNRDRQGVLL